MFAAGSIHAQQVYHEFSIGASFGPNGMILNHNREQLNIGAKPAVGGGLDMEYIVHFSNNWSFILGASVQYYGQNYNISSIFENSPQRTAIPQYSDFILKTEVRNYSERYNVLFVQVPVLFGYETSGEFSRFYLRLGAKFSIPVIKNYDASIEMLKTSGYREQENWTMGDKYPFLGFGTQHNVKIKGKADIGIGADGYFEAGVKVPVRVARGKDFNFYAGIFGQINILGNKRGGDNYLVGYSGNDNRSPVVSDHLSPQSITNTRYITQERMFLAGVTIRFSFDFGKRNVKMFMHK
jgi:hypothetical protein